MKNNMKMDLWLSRIGLGLIFCYCFLASLFEAYFAQIHLTLRFFPFPIFIGEILLLICFLLWAWVAKDGRFFSSRTRLLLSLYFGWVLVKASINYRYDGPLTCRNAALFYYPVFAVFAYCFYQRSKIPRQALMALVFLAAGCMLFKLVYVWCWWTYLTLFVIAVWNIKPVQWRWLGGLFVAVIFILGKEYLYEGPRAHFVSVFFAVLFLVFYFAVFLAKRRDFVRLVFLLIGLGCFMIGYFFFANHNDMHSLTSLKSMITTYQEFDDRYQEKQVDYVPKDLTVHLYNPKIFGAVSQSSTDLITQPQTSLPPAAKSESVTKEFPFLSSRIREGRDLELDENNIVFRLFVWRDMARELIQKKAWFGFSFGHPQRSRSLEVLDWARTEWGRDGWITPHNSFFHVIYRAGILGVIFLGVLFFMVGKLVRDFFNLNSVEGGLLVGALVYWMVLSNFFVILEFPYNAIIFWTLFGITWAYHDEIKGSAL